MCCYRILPDNHRKFLHISVHSESMNTYVNGMYFLMFYNYTRWNLAYRQVLAQDQFLSALKYLSFGTNPSKEGLNIPDPRCFIDKLVNELVKCESVLLFQMEEDFVAWEWPEKTPPGKHFEGFSPRYS